MVYIGTPETESEKRANEVKKKKHNKLHEWKGISVNHAPSQ